MTSNLFSSTRNEPENLDPYHDNGPSRNQSNQNTLPNPASKDSFFDDDFEQAVDLEAVTAIEQQSQKVENETKEEFLEDIDFEPSEYRLVLKLRV